MLRQAHIGICLQDMRSGLYRRLALVMLFALTTACAGFLEHADNETNEAVGPAIQRGNDAPLPVLVVG